MKYQVIDTGNLADCHNCSGIDKSWDKSLYGTFEEAYDYAIKWFYPYLEGVPKESLKDSKKYEYGENCYCQIQEIKNS